MPILWVQEEKVKKGSTVKRRFTIHMQLECRGKMYETCISIVSTMPTNMLPGDETQSWLEGLKRSYAGKGITVLGVTVNHSVPGSAIS